MEILTTPPTDTGEFGDAARDAFLNINIKTGAK